MVYTRETERAILDFVRQAPRSINELAHRLGRNWRTADTYVERAARETGLVATKVFRGGTRGALKIVYWNALDERTASASQAALLQRILSSRRKEEFSALDIYQFVPDKRREVRVVKREALASPSSLLRKTSQQFLSLSGNLSWLNLYPDAWRELEQMAGRRVSIKILTRIDLTSQQKTEQLLAINQRVGWDAIAIRHAEQPLRAMILDDHLASLKEVLSPDTSAYKELKEELFLFYRISDEEWVRWLQQVFWKIWESSVSAATRLEALANLPQELTRSLTSSLSGRDSRRRASAPPSARPSDSDPSSSRHRTSRGGRGRG